MMCRLRASSLLALLTLGACSSHPTASQPALPASATLPAGPVSLTPGNDRIDGRIAPVAPPRASLSYGRAVVPPAAAGATAETGTGDISFDFADTDLRTAVAQILGTILKVNYTIDPSVSGTVTLHTVAPLSRDQVLPTLQTLLAQNNAVLVQNGGLYRVMPAGGAGGSALGGSVFVPLRYANAPQLAAVLQPFVAKGGRIIADPDSNALVIQGDPATRDALSGMAQSFDTDALAGQSYALYPVPNGNAKDVGDALAAALSRQGQSKGRDAVTIVPLQRISAVLVIARTPGLLADAARVYHVLNQSQIETLRSWHVFYLRNSRANDAAYLLQEAITPDNVTAQPTPAAVQSDDSGMNSSNSSSSNGSGSTGSSYSGSTSGTTTSSGTQTGADQSAKSSGGSGQNATAGASALLGPLSATSGNTTSNGPRIIPDAQNNALLVYATAAEDDQITGMLAKIDIQPLQVRIDATIAEVDLTGQLQYGTQFFFKSGDINAVLSTASTSALATSFPGFVLSGNGSDAAPIAISALQAVTKVRVLSSPELMVLDGQAASLQVGDVVPYLTQTSQDTLTSTSQVINSVDYRETGVILRVTPHVGSGGLVVMDVRQEVSGVSPTITTTGLNSPTFTERSVTSRVAIQDGQTIGLAGLISDNDSHENQGLPVLKDVPLLGALFGSQTNKRTREELLVLITPHVIRSQQEALDLTADMQQQMPNAAQVESSLQSTPISGSADPNARLRARLSQ
ncbi:MAG TPA: type II secretion system secretin GspD [Acidisoma sp.]|uniref:type II secretion system secretin GspD n=1 Tax=Acidisoma sp. TaxID=1872115 RepID=UPI002B760A00|nr:type II secretion system secretin GspD [Acidisoma sp.]HTH99929.1 type II secretion system secretin GspD [Acidisoma sp.]